MKTKTLITVTLTIFVLGLGACNMGPETELDTNPEAHESYAEQSQAVSYNVDPPECYGLRQYYRWACENGEWELEWAGRRDIWCDGSVLVAGDETNCYADFATYNCDTHLACGQYQFVCPAEPTLFCRPSFSFPTQFARR